MGFPSSLRFERSALAHYLELTKPSITGLILISAWVGFYMGSRGSWSLAVLLETLGAVGLLAGGTAALNQCFEADSDARMRRTAERPIPTGSLRPVQGLVFGLALSTAGIFLALAVNLLTGVLGILTWASYLFLYTPLKRHTTWCTLVGAFPGAAPVLIGWAAARGSLDSGAVLLYLILFLWQFPHFLAIAWMYREDYARGGIAMLPVENLSATVRQVVFFSLALLPVSLLPTVLGMDGRLYFWGAAIMGTAFFYFGLRLAFRRTAREARNLLQASVFYLPLIYALMVVDKVLPRLAP